MCILFNDDGKLYYKIYSKKDIDTIAKNMKNNTGVYDTTVLGMLAQTTPADDIRYLNALVYWDLNEPISVEWFPKNWGYIKIIEFLISKYNSENYSFSWYEEVRPDAQEYGLHIKSDFNKPYIDDDLTDK